MGKDKEKKAKVKATGKKNGEVKTNRLLSIRMKILALVLFSTVIAVSITAEVIVSYSKTLVVDSAYGKMLNVVTSYGSMVDKTENGKKLEKEEYKELLKDVTLDGIESANCYLVERSGVIYFHKDESKVGKPNKNKVITDVVAGITKGKTPDNLCLEYEDEDGKQKYASFYITPGAKSILVMEADADELNSPIKAIVKRALFFAIVITILAMIIALFVINGITKPLKEITRIINHTAKLNLVVPESLSKLCGRRDETGEIARAVKVMTDSLKDVVENIETANKSIERNMQRLEESSNQVNTFCTDNSRTAEALSVSTEEMAEKLQAISGRVDDVRAKSENIGEVTNTSNELSEEIAGRAQNMQATTIEAIANTRSMYQQLKEKTDAAVEGLQAVSKINVLTAAISDISDQTSLLSLNASIEAARAGDAGRGFVVVASEISNLASKSLENVSNINLVIKEVNQAVSNISKAMEETSIFLEKNVLANYDGFNDIGNQYLADAASFKETMTSISGEIVELNEAISKIVYHLDDVKNTMHTTSEGVVDIADKTSNVVQATSDNYDLTNNTVGRVGDLKLIVDKFQR